MQIEHFSHLHPLTRTRPGYDSNVQCHLCDDFFSDPPTGALSQTAKVFSPGSSDCKCSTCGIRGYDDNIPIFVCVTPGCDYAIHLHCTPSFPIPETVKHRDHQHYLTCTTREKRGSLEWCSFCGLERNPDIPAYYCDECDYAVHVGCGISECKVVSHCFGCWQVLLPLVEEYKSKTDLKSIGASLHPGREEVPSNLEAPQLDIETVEDDKHLTPVLELRHADHLLLLFDPVSFRDCLFKCSVCHDKIGDPVSKSPVFVCVIPKCGYALHFHRTPFAFPETVKIRKHYHQLKLTESVVEDDSGEYYCEACERRRNPNHPIYYCEECEYIAHVSCSVAEMLPSLVMEYENKIAAPTASLDNLLKEAEERLSLLRSRKEEIQSRLEVLRIKGRAVRDKRAPYVEPTLSDAKILQDHIQLLMSRNLIKRRLKRFELGAKILWYFDQPFEKLELLHEGMV
ncbi:uncharacterized protein LOC125315280 [Rhodamnia argentea]|uniref:Uncharacterized protein LOC125315280 n=1 Tax=Rhodamnia argentea TaxID=178133 RepID=A0ABM3HGF9_9MYRT|nr:uncharacterized protein LOC125315280 [Rhodamnia argentea]